MFRRPRFLLLGLALIVGVFIAVLLVTVGRSPAGPPLPNPNGYDDFIKAGAAVMGNDFPALDRDRLAALVSTNAEPLRLLRLGLTRQCLMPLDSTLTNNAALTQLSWMPRLATCWQRRGGCGRWRTGPPMLPRATSTSSASATR